MDKVLSGGIKHIMPVQNVTSFFCTLNIDIRIVADRWAGADKTLMTVVFFSTYVNPKINVASMIVCDVVNEVVLRVPELNVA
jgi:hypothetical protein